MYQDSNRIDQTTLGDVAQIMKQANANAEQTGFALTLALYTIAYYCYLETAKTLAASGNEHAGDRLAQIMALLTKYVCEIHGDNGGGGNDGRE